MKRLLSGLFLFLIFSCQDVENVEKPKDLIGEDKMVEILTELSLLSAAQGYNLSQLQGKGIKPAEYLFSKYNIDSTQFANSNNYYADYIDEYEKIFDRVKDTLELLKSRNDSVLTEKRKRRDSIQKFELPNEDDVRRDSIIRERRKLQARELSRGLPVVPGIED